MPESPPPTYLFLDEAGNFDFSTNGTKYFMLTCLTVTRPFAFEQDLANLRCDFLEKGDEVSHFHAAEDSIQRRKAVFGLIEKNLDKLRVDAVVVQKNKTNPSLRDEGKFYCKIMGVLLKYVFDSWTVSGASRPVVITDRIPLNRKRTAVEKAVKMTLADVLGPKREYGLHHFESKSWAGLQMADYVSWAMYRKWAIGDRTFYDKICPCIKSEFDVFAVGTTTYY